MLKEFQPITQRADDLKWNVLGGLLRADLEAGYALEFTSDQLSRVARTTVASINSNFQAAYNSVGRTLFHHKNKVVAGLGLTVAALQVACNVLGGIIPASPTPSPLLATYAAERAARVATPTVPVDDYKSITCEGLSNPQFAGVSNEDVVYIAFDKGVPDQGGDIVDSLAELKQVQGFSNNVVAKCRGNRGIFNNLHARQWAISTARGLKR